MTIDTPAIFAQRAVDLGDIRARLEAREQANLQAQLADEEAQIVAWDKAMNRAFKGIMPRSTRRIFMRAAVGRAEREGVNF